MTAGALKSMEYRYIESGTLALVLCTYEDVISSGALTKPEAGQRALIVGDVLALVCGELTWFQSDMLEEL